ncbi:xanthine dehydrogenase family protein molybdopterin-binding subunit [Paracoccus tegillarcae]|uniref:Twin-arginine translocation pathway signal protein n=1 Tax=Paracoccus tegillarcae TaxID=1529068 RepID=A0A2K9EFX3_9RHOB|nr:xanthine dehydrogenase family protein molybdopterin-binding subunit [Paracoccus tegillarcae]AUH32227.1 twin-arginine translocation pathway signal protein [Paracoccus tegillarcae]
MTIQTTRRGFLAAAGGFIVALTLPVRGAKAQAAAPQMLPPNAYVHIGEDDLVTVMVRNIEFGQGPMTGMATLVAEELDADWSQMRAESAPADPVYANPLMGMQGTGGSTALASSYMQMRQVGATMRHMLVAAAAAEWGVPADEITVEKGRIKHGSGQEAGFGAFATAAAQTEPPTEAPALKDPADFILIGTDLRKPDTSGKTDGTAMFGLDRYIEGMQTVVIARPNVIGATVASFDDAAALAVSGVQAVRQLPVGVAVYADNTFAALKGRDALTVEWDMANAETRDSAQIHADFTAAAQETGLDAEVEGDLSVLDGEGLTMVEAEYSFPFLAHAPMEPLNGVIELKDGKATAWYGAQFPGGEQPAMAQVLELPAEDVVLNVTLAGGSFGRRAQPSMHMAAELAMVAKAAGDGAYKVVWTREDDIRGAYYRPKALHRFRAGLDADGQIVGWENIIATPSIIRGTFFEEMMMGNGLDTTSFEGANELPYDLGARRIGWVETTVKIPLLWWRSVGSSHTASAVEGFMDEVLLQAGRDPVQGRLDMLKEGEDRPRAVIEKVAEMAGWPDGAAEGRALGFAYAKSFGTFVAQVAEVEDRNGFPHVTRVWCAVDCGVAVNPNVIRAQVEGGIGYGLCAALFDEITLGEGGAVQQSNFDNYRMLRIAEMPAVEVEIIASDADPTGIGEPGVPPIAPAVMNAWRKLTGQTVRELPFTRSLNS